MAEIEDLLRLRNELVQTSLGDVLLRFLHDKLTCYAGKDIDAIELKGMGRLIQDIKDIPKSIENKRS